MKRIAAFLVALLLVATCTVYVSAAGATATMSSATAERGDEVDLTITLADAPKVKYMVFELSLPEGITLLSGEWLPSPGDVQVGNLQGAWMTLGEMDTNGAVVSLKVKVEETATCGDNAVNFKFYVDQTAEKDANVAETAGVITVAHDWDEELTKTDAEGHYYACAGCDEKKDEAEHEFELPCDETCDICGYVRTGAEHDFSETYEKDDEKHWFECECGAKDSEAEHDYEYDCDDKCDTCGYVREAADHQPVGDVKYDDDGHWGECACGEQIDKTAHEFEYECSTECMHCEYTREADHDFSDMYDWDEEGHSRECMYGCGEKTDVGTHVFDQEIKDEWTIVESANCMHGDIYAKSCICGYIDWENAVTFEVGEPDEDAHRYVYDYETDTAICLNGCENDLEDVKGEAVEEIEGDGATLTAPEGSDILGENFELTVEDATENIADIDFGEFDEELEGYKAVEYKGYFLSAGEAAANFTEGMTLTVKLPDTKKFTDVKLIWALNDAPAAENELEYVDNGDGTITITVTAEMESEMADYLEYEGETVLPVLFIGKPVPSATGDNGLTVLWIAVLVIAALGLVATAVYSKKRKATK